MNKRISLIRKNIGLNQQEFADRIGLTKNYVSLMETGSRNPSDRTVSDICREFNVNEVWLRTGEGEPFQEESRHELIMRFASQTINGSDEFKKDFVAMLAKMDADDWKSLAKLFTKLSGETKKSDPSK